MSWGPVHLVRSTALIGSAAICMSLPAQSPDSATLSQAEKATLPSGIERLAGTEPTSHIQYVRLILKGSLVPPGSPPPDPPPFIMAQCTLRPNGKNVFDMLANFGGVTDLAFYPPWKSSGPGDYPPTTKKVTVTMDFLGYTHVKPAKKQWEIPIETPDQYRYNQPGFSSSNMEDFSYYLQFLVALPTLRLTFEHRSSEFNMTPLLQQIRKEPMCVAARLR
jgi:hypothetical protein